MKVSKYNFFIPTKDENFFIAYNTLSGSISIIDGEVKKALQANALPSDENALEKLKKTNLIIDDEIDEKKLYQYTHNRFKHNNSY
ncbi:MAG: hypothetical protein PHD95_01765, partial [Candidatus ainarchaeum sp.]|nr:hypothetical protein [Candidatus ainarchaeum sp.]